MVYWYIINHGYHYYLKTMLFKKHTLSTLNIMSLLQPHISIYTLRLSNCIYYINCEVILLMEYEVRSVPTELTPSTKSNVKTNVYA